MKIWIELLSNISTVGILSGLAFFLIKLLLSKYFDKEQALFKLQTEQNIEHYKNELIILSEMKNYLHKERMIALRELYQKINQCESDMSQFFAVIKTTLSEEGKSEEETAQEQQIERIKKAHDSFYNLLDFYRDSKVLFTKETCKVLDSLLKAFDDCYREFTFPTFFSINDVAEIRNSFRAAKTIFDSDIIPIKRRVEEEFRELVGVYSPELKNDNAIKRNSEQNLTNTKSN